MLKITITAMISSKVNPWSFLQQLFIGKKKILKTELHQLGTSFPHRRLAGLRYRPDQGNRKILKGNRTSGGG
jgi:hypothetical protein